MGYVYILRSLSNSRMYVGSCIDLEKRIFQHQSGYVRSTKSLLPVRLEFSQKFETIKQARQIEYKLKKLKSRVILERIIKEKSIKLAQ